MKSVTSRVQSVLTDLNQRHYAFASRQGETLLRRLEAHIAAQSLVGDAAFFEPEHFPWIQELETHWLTIRQELDQVLEWVRSLPNFQDISADQASITQDDRWKTYFLYGYGFKAAGNCRRCPETTRLIEQIPGMKTAFFSILLPQKHIPEHRGPYKGVLRYHLALKVPQPAEQCGLRVGNQVRHWQEGKSLVFDDTWPHAAWNDTDEMRVVLFVDVVRPLRRPFCWLNQAMIRLIAISPYVQDAKHKALYWEAKLDAIAPP